MRAFEERSIAPTTPFIVQADADDVVRRAAGLGGNRAYRRADEGSLPRTATARLPMRNLLIARDSYAGAVNSLRRFGKPLGLLGHERRHVAASGPQADLVTFNKPVAIFMSNKLM